MTEVSQETKNALEGARTEIGANMVLAPKAEFGEGWNAGAAMAIKFIRGYERGEGLFQRVTDWENKGEG